MNYFIYKIYLPEIFFSASILLLIVANTQILAKVKNNLIEQEVFVQSIVILAILFGLCFFCNLNVITTNLGIVNPSIKFIRLIFILFCVGSLFLAFLANKIHKINFSEYYFVVLLSIFGLLFMITSKDFLLFYLAMETQALCFYVLAAINRKSFFSIEASLKYFISGSFMSCIFLLGSSFIYGTLGTINIGDLYILLKFDLESFENIQIFVISSTFLILVVLLFKLSCAPFHFWAPDVYEGAPISSTVLFSILPKLAIFSFFLDLISSIGVISEIIESVLLSVGIFSAFLGTFYGLKQIRIKRLIIFSSVAQTGFLICGISFGTLEGNVTTIFFLVLYLITSLVLWGHLIIYYLSYSKFNSEIFGQKTLHISNFRTYYIKNSLWSISLIIVFFSIGGCPPLGGFLAKILILHTLVEHNYIFGSFLLIAISSVSFYYYIKILKIIFFEVSQKELSFELFKVVFNDNLFDIFNQQMVILLFLLLFSFFDPYLFQIISYNIALYSFV